jgi:hypothetical protein
LKEDNRYERAGAQFTRFTSTKVKILTQLGRASGWTTWKKKDSLDAKKKKFNKDGSEKKTRNVQPKVQTVGHLAPPKQPSTNVPRYVWLAGGGGEVGVGVGVGVLYKHTHIHTHTHTYIYICIHTYTLHICIYINIHTYIYAYIYTYTHTYTYTYTYIYVYMYIYYNFNECVISTVKGGSKEWSDANTSLYRFMLCVC